MDGRLVQVAVQKGAKVDLFIPTIMSKRLRYTGSTLRPRTVQQKAAIAKAVEHNLWPLFEKGDIKPLIYTTFPLTDAADAHALMESSDHIKEDHPKRLARRPSQQRTHNQRDQKAY